MGQLKTKRAWAQSIPRRLSFAAFASAILSFAAASLASGASASPRILHAATSESRGSHATVITAAISGAVGSDGSSATAADSSFHAAAGQEAALQLSPCELEHPQRLTVVAADCGVLSVPEDPTRTGGRQIRLAFARVPAVSRSKRPDPLFLLAGGPGMAATTFYAMTAPVFARIHRDRDIVLVDQRGTGKSNPLDCPEGDETDLGASGGSIIDETRRCLQMLGAKADVAQYTTSVAVKDLDRVRRALGYQQINLYGVSYGTRVAQQYLRRFPRQTRSLILDGVVPPELSFGAGMAIEWNAVGGNPDGAGRGRRAGRGNGIAGWERDDARACCHPCWRIFLVGGNHLFSALAFVGQPSTALGAFVAFGFGDVTGHGIVGRRGEGFFFHAG